MEGGTMGRMRTRGQGAHGRVLVVDDDENILELLRAALADEGYEVECARDGAEALASVRRQLPDVILLDLMMPNVSGWSFLQLYRETPAPHAPVVAVSAIAPSALRFPEGQVHDVVRKPFSVDALLHVVAATAQGRMGGSETPERAN